MTSTRALLLPLSLLVGLTALPAGAEKADRSKPMTLESDKPCTVNLQKKTSVCTGNVVVSQGTLLIRADKLELRESDDGYQMATATGTDGRAAHYRQKRDASDEYIEGQSRRIDYDSRVATVRFDGDATVRRLLAGITNDEIHGALIIWDSDTEVFNVQGGATTPANPGGRVRAVLAPRQPAASAPAAPAAASAPVLRSSPTLGERR
jgi:lipopolysaccharide export system protein LptA